MNINIREALGEIRNTCRNVVGKPEVKRSLWRLRYTREVNIKTDLRERGCGCEKWVQLAQVRVPFIADNLLSN
jgi:hypothetical protein